MSKIKEAFEKSGKNIKAISLSMRMPKCWVQDVIDGKIIPNTQKAAQLAILLKTSTKDLFTD